MRIIGGAFRRRNLKSPPEKSTTRPLPDHVREAVFNLLRGHFEGVDVLDCFAGTGSFGLEAVSRGARRVVMVERDKRVARVLAENVGTLGVEDRAEIVVSDALGAAALSRCPRPAHIIFMDPPYEMVRDPEDWPRVRTQLERLIRMLTPDGYAILRTPWPFVHALDPNTGEPITPSEAKRRFEEAKAAYLDEAFESGAAQASAQAPARRNTDVDLSMSGALGPETHVYGTTAVHLYMREMDG
ncbi:MAG: 16S rRNA (guanine(966)-N(2))-methyltransferase RsmD [Phycisphaerales bacterium JB059]